jgi:signal transduction histidine kinase
MFSTALLQELREPISVIQLAIQNALAESVNFNCPAVMRRDLQTALAASATVATVIRNSRGTAGWLPKATETDVCVRDVAERVLRLLQSCAQQARIHLRTEDLDGLPALRMWESDCEQLFFALTQNAVQAADGRSDHHLLITGAHRGSRITLQFQDDCGGIEPEDLPKMFNPFAAANATGKGTRLGLCVAHRIVRQRGGRISVQNRGGEGTTFLVVLPVNRI